jgi:hypothetical protein
MIEIEDLWFPYGRTGFQLHVPRPTGNLDPDNKPRILGLLVGRTQ